MSRTRRWHASVAVGGTALAGALAGCAGGLDAERATGGYVTGDYGISVLPADQRPAAPAVEGESLEGDRVSLARFDGRVVVVNVWGQWCTECRSETDDLVAAQRTLRRQGVAFFGIDIRDDRAGALAYTRSSGVGWPSLYDPDSSSLLGFRGSMTAAATPTTYVVDEQGRLAARLLGPQTEQTLTDVVEQVRDG